MRARGVKENREEGLPVLFAGSHQTVLLGLISMHGIMLGANLLRILKD